MIEFRFAVRPDQGEASAFDLGDMTCLGDAATVTSAGRSPDQGTMIRVAVIDLIDTFLRRMSDGRFRHVEYIATDSSFRLDFRETKKGVKVRAAGELVGEVGLHELGEALLRAADAFIAPPADDIPERGVRADLHRAVEGLRTWCTGG